MDKTIICPGCGWTGTVETLSGWGACPKCGYENGLEPYRLLTLSEMLADDEGEYNDACVGLFLKSLFNLLGYPDNRDVGPTSAIQAGIV